MTIEISVSYDLKHLNEFHFKTIFQEKEEKSIAGLPGIKYLG